MTSSRVFGIGLIALSCILFISHPALAQQTSAIAGLVRDTSGGVLPGVTVEAASPVLIEKVRTVVTDDQGRYNILVMPGSMYDHRIRRRDVRVTKQVRLTPRLRMQGNLDVYNVFNGGSAVQINNAFGQQWRQPTEVQDPRILQFSAQLNF